MKLNVWIFGKYILHESQFNQFWGPAVLEVSCEFGFVHSMYWLVWLQCKISEIVHHCSTFCMKLDRKVMEPNFWKKALTGHWGSRSLKYYPEMKFSGFKKNPIHSRVHFYLIVKSLMIFHLFIKTSCLGKILFLNYGSKTSRPSKM